MALHGVIITSGGDSNSDGHPDSSVLEFPPGIPQTTSGYRLQVNTDGLPYADTSLAVVPVSLGLFFDAVTGDPYLDPDGSTDPSAELFVDGDGTPYLMTGA